MIFYKKFNKELTKSELKHKCSNPIEWLYFNRIDHRIPGVQCARMYYKMKVPITEIAVCSFLQIMMPGRYILYLYNGLYKCDFGICICKTHIC